VEWGGTCGEDGGDSGADGFDACGGRLVGEAFDLAAEGVDDTAGTRHEVGNPHNIPRGQQIRHRVFGELVVRRAHHERGREPCRCLRAQDATDRRWNEHVGRCAQRRVGIDPLIA
jgi:hypothetical protein